MRIRPRQGPGRPGVGANCLREPQVTEPALAVPFPLASDTVNVHSLRELVEQAVLHAEMKRFTISVGEFRSR